ncbi:hypothetical protein TNCV_5005131 [Trichonephila clavipes]|uniref:Uncharacterized protein n=1 Tax=Trichonephila clavipes TaxID=2585209 RepID=A0A8X6RGY2_TRICX|nr:hypothetical protein TNCV_5005131 [Trichonephila clavipes]
MTTRPNCDYLVSIEWMRYQRQWVPYRIFFASPFDNRQVEIRPNVERVSNERGLNERVSNDIVFVSKEMVFDSNEMIFNSNEMVSNETVFMIHFKGNGFK